MQRVWTFCICAAVLFSWGLFTACVDKTETGAKAPRGYPFKVTATVGMITDIVAQVAGEHAEVEGLIGEGIDPHLYAPSRADVKALREADIIFYNGLMLEGKMADVFTKMARKGKKVYAVTEAVQTSGDFVILDDSDHYDPHIWMDVSGWIRAVEGVRDVLIEFDPSHKDDYSERSAAYLELLGYLDAFARETIGTIPAGQRVLVTAHDAFGYMARAYGLEVRGIQGITTEAKAGLRDVEGLVTFLVERKIPAVFVESSVPRKSVEALIEGAQARGHEVEVGGELFSDAMGQEGTYRGSYVGMIDHNVSTIARALGGTVPEGGFQQWLRSKR